MDNKEIFVVLLIISRAMKLNGQNSNVCCFINGAGARCDTEDGCNCPCDAVNGCQACEDTSGCTCDGICTEKDCTYNNITTENPTNSSADCPTCTCFHGESHLMTPFGPKKMEDIKRHDKVLTVGQDGLPAFEPVYMMTHAEPDRLAKFVRLATESGNELTLTPGHFVYVGKEGTLMVAKDVKVGDALLVVADNASYPVMSRAVRKRELALRGIYNPITPGGAVVVDGVLASVYPDIPPISARGAHSLLWMVRQLVARVPVVGQHVVAAGEGTEGMPAWLWALEIARDNIMSVLSRG